MFNLIYLSCLIRMFFATTSVVKWSCVMQLFALHYIKFLCMLVIYPVCIVYNCCSIFKTVLRICSYDWFYLYIQLYSLYMRQQLKNKSTIKQYSTRPYDKCIRSYWLQCHTLTMHVQYCRTENIIIKISTKTWRITFIQMSLQYERFFCCNK